MTLLVRDLEAFDPKYPAAIRVDSDFWFEWLNGIKSFRYECRDGNVTVIKDNRKYWTASKKVKGKLKRKRLGVSSGITRHRLGEAVRLLCNSDRDRPNPSQAMLV